MLNILRRRIGTEEGFGLVGILIVIVLLIVVGGTGTYVWHRDHKAKPSTGSTTQSKSTTSSTKSAPPPTDPYAGWKTYTSTFEKLSFRYPSNWTATPSSGRFGVTGADSLQLEDPSGKVAVSWYSAVQGLGGACDSTIMPGTAVASGALSPCPYWYVLDKQKLSGADLYYVDGVTTSDGTTYSPWCALQAPDGVLSSKGSIGYMLFKGKNNDFVQNGHDFGLQEAGLLCSKSSLGGAEAMTGTKAQATAYLSSPEMQQAKLMLLSASY
jgi:hypothetical protein